MRPLPASTPKVLLAGRFTPPAVNGDHLRAEFPFGRRANGYVSKADPASAPATSPRSRLQSQSSCTCSPLRASRHKANVQAQAYCLCRSGPPGRPPHPPVGGQPGDGLLQGSRTPVASCPAAERRSVGSPIIVTLRGRWPARMESTAGRRSALARCLPHIRGCASKRSADHGQGGHKDRPARPGADGCARPRNGAAAGKTGTRTPDLNCRLLPLVTTALCPFRPLFLLILIPAPATLEP